jgi:branched-chain amino acid transport system permease protein
MNDAKHEKYQSIGKPITSWKRSPLLFILIFVFLLLPLIITNPFYLSIVILILFYTFLSLSWNVQGGFVGQLSLGHAAYAGIGAYTSTVLFMRLNLSPWIGMWIGGLFAAIIGFAIAYPCTKLRGAYYALGTLAFSLVLKIIIENTNFLGGAGGLVIPLLKTSPLHFQFLDKKYYYYAILLMLIGVIYISYRIMNSRCGYYFRAIRNDEDAAKALGINSIRYKILAAMISAFFTGIAGTFYAQFILFISPERILDPGLSFQIAIMAIIGGRGTIAGPILGAFLLVLTSEITKLLVGGRVMGAELVLYSLVLMVVIRYRPQGVGGLVTEAYSSIGARFKNGRMKAGQYGNS